jgi:hypothetical protein
MFLSDVHDTSGDAFQPHSNLARVNAWKIITKLVSALRSAKRANRDAEEGA